MTRGAVKVMHRGCRSAPLCSALWVVGDMMGEGVEKKRDDIQLDKKGGRGKETEVK